MLNSNSTPSDAGELSGVEDPVRNIEAPSNSLRGVPMNFLMFPYVISQCAPKNEDSKEQWKHLQQPLKGSTLEGTTNSNHNHHPTENYKVGMIILIPS